MADLSQIPDDELETMLRERLAKETAPPSPVKPFKSNALGFVDAVTAPVGNALGWVNRGLRAAGAPAIPGVDERVAYQRARLDANKGELGKFAGQVGTGLALAPIKAGTAVQGGIQGAINSRADNVGDLTEDTLWGVAGSVAGDQIIKRAASAISPAVRPAVTRLKALGVPVTPGQALGGAWQRAEDLAMSIPLVGPAISSARKAGRSAFEEATANQVLAPIQDQIDPGTGGRDAVRVAGDKLRASYAALTPQLGAKVDNTFVTRTLATKAKANLPAPYAEQLDEVLRREISNGFDVKTGKIDGRRFKQLEERLGDLASSWRKSDDPYQRDLGNAVGEVREHLFGMLQRQNPKAAEQLRNANKGWRRLVAVENAAGTASGDVTPGRLFQGIRAADRSSRKAAAKRGTTDLSQLAQDGYEVLGDVAPNSGTADRALFAGGLLGVGTGAAAVTPYAALAGLGAVPYLPGVRKGTEWLFTGRQGAVPRMIGRRVRQLAPLAAASVPPLLARPQD